MATPLTSIAVRCLDTLLRRRRLLWTLAVLLAAAALWAILNGRYTNDLAHAFPSDSQAGQMYGLLQKSRLTQSVQIELAFDAGGARSCATAAAAEDGGPPTRPELTARLLELESRLEALHEVADATVHYNVQAGALVREIIGTLPLAQPPEILKEASPRQAAAALRRAMAMPGTPLADMRADPFGLRLPLLQRLADFQAAAGLQADMTDGFLLSPDGTRALVLVEPRFDKAPDGDAIIRLFTQLEQACHISFPEAKCLIVSPLRHNLENEQAVRSGLLTATAASVALLFLLLVGLYRKAWDALWLPCLPLLSTLLVTGLMALLFRPLCLFVVGIGGGIAGLAIDQCIHVFAAHADERPLQRIASLLRPLLLSALTSAAVFLLVATTGISAYRQLGLFAALILTVNLLLSLALLPGLLKRRTALAFTLPAFHPGPRLAAAVSLLWATLMALAATALPRLKTDFSLKALDGTSTATTQAEEAMMRRWRPSDKSAMLVVAALDEDTALARCEALAEAVQQEGQKPPFHAALLWPSRATREANLAAWRQPETRRRLDELHVALQQELTAGGLPAALCDNFFASIELEIKSGDRGTMPEAYREIMRALLRATPDGVTALAFAPENSDSLLKAAAAVPDTAVASADAFQKATWAAVQPRLRHLGRWLLPVLLLALFPLLRRPTQLLVVALPGATALVIGGALAVLCGYAFNLVALFSLAMLTGLVLDYGLFALHARQAPDSLPTAMLLSALTSIATTAALTTSRHPVMFHTGLVLSVGILLTALTALVVVPALLRCAAALRPRRNSLIFLIILGGGLFFSGCQTSLTPPPAIGPTVSQETAEAAAFRRAFQTPRTCAYTMKTAFLWKEFTVLVVIRTDGETLQAVGTAPNGMTLFAVAGDCQRQTKSHFADAIPQAARRRLFGTLAQDLARIFLETPEAEHIYGREPLQLLYKRNGRFPRRQWQAAYEGWHPETQTYDTILYRNFDARTTFTLKARP